MSDFYVELSDRPCCQIWSLGFHRWFSLSDSQQLALMVRNDFDYNASIRELEAMGLESDRLEYYAESAEKDVEKIWLSQGNNIDDLWVEESNGDFRYSEKGQDLYIDILNKQEDARSIYKAVQGKE